MNTPAAKRRRVDAANATLRKPFHSPLLRRQPDAGQSSTPGSSKTPELNSSKRSFEEVYSPSSPSAPRRPHPAGGSSLPPGKLAHRRPASPLRLSVASRPTRTAGQKFAGSKGETRSGSADQNPFFALAKVHRTTGRDAIVRDLDRRLETVRQAGDIEAASEKIRPGEPVDQELRDLVVKWKGASRLAAEELFETVKERVDNAGGPKAWKEMQQRQMEFYRGFDQEPTPNSNPSDEDFDAEYSQDVQAHLAGGGRGKEAEGKRDEDDEPEFTMAHMLRSLNIDFSLLGYDQKEDKWIS